MANNVEYLKRKNYNYLSRYADLRLVKNDNDKKIYYETSNKNKNISNYLSYKVQQGDTLDKLALKYYGNSLYWWVIAENNNMLDVISLKVGTEIKIPNISMFIRGE